MQATRTPQQESAEDVFFGQIVIIWARWFLILAGTILTLWGTTNAGDLVVSILPIAALMAMNFYLHGRYLMERPANRLLLLITCGLDVLIITLIVIVWQPKGLTNPFFIFYYPVLLAVAFVFPRRISASYTLLVGMAYTGACFIVNSSFLAQVSDQKTLFQRLILMAALTGVGTFYWSIERDRRRVAEKGVL
jgi:hypothetical protein